MRIDRAPQDFLAQNTPQSRRQHLQWLAGVGMAALLPYSGAAAAALPTAPWPVTEQLFGLGVASGEPMDTAVVLWTRLTGC